ncbi:MAG TPA: DUF4260 family protein [Candidatus Saccharimonadales bacterium]|nr:DUF4260 family protein [Candidatus Saccharimonadales bacterium]
MSDRGVAAILRAEQVALVVAGIVIYLSNRGALILLLPLLLAPDLSMVGYLGGPRLGAVTYNAAHNLVLALGALGIGWRFDVGWLLLLGAVLIAHVGGDRALGYGLKLPSDFRDTHLGRIGRS